MKKLSNINEDVLIDIIMRDKKRNGRKEDINALVYNFLKEKIENDPYHISTIIDSYKINSDNTVDIVGNISIDSDDLVNGELPFKFGKILKLDGEPHNEFYELSRTDIMNIHGSFNIRNTNPKLKTLKNCPYYVDGTFDCSRQYSIETLEGSPRYCDCFVAQECFNLKSLKGCPDEIKGKLILRNSTANIETTEYFPKKVGEFIDMTIVKHYYKNCDTREFNQKFTKEDIASKCECDERRIILNIIY